MALIVQKFGGSSVADAQRVSHVAGIIANTYRQGNQVVVVVSAQGKTTDHLIAQAQEVNPNPSKRELDALMATGELASMALMALALERLGMPAISLSGWQAGIHTDSTHGAARVSRIDTERLRNELDKGNIVIVAGFQGVNKYEDITTLGRGGSDTSAVALAAALNADLCQIYTDVDGVYTADPRIVPNAIKIDEITYDEMLELASLGANVLHNRSVEMAKKYNVNLDRRGKTADQGCYQGCEYRADLGNGRFRPAGYRVPSVLAAGKAQGQRGHHSPVGGPGRYPGHQLHRGCQGRR